VSLGKVSAGNETAVQALLDAAVSAAALGDAGLYEAARKAADALLARTRDARARAAAGARSADGGPRRRVPGPGRQGAGLGRGQPGAGRAGGHGRTAVAERREGAHRPARGGVLLRPPGAPRRRRLLRGRGGGLPGGGGLLVGTGERRVGGGVRP